MSDRPGGRHRPQWPQWPPATGRLVVAECASTMEEAARRAPQLAAPTWIMAERQTAGRGRRGRAWHAPAGNFAATLLLRPQMPPPARALHSFIAALALADALAMATGTPARFSLKWPNDVLLDGQKLAGILLESRGDLLLIGIGVNLAAAPDPARLEAGALAPVALAPATDCRIAPAQFLDLLAPAFARHAATFAAHGFAPIRRAWLARAAHLGGEIRVRAGGACLTGRFETLDEHGALVLDTGSGLRRIAAGDVFFSAREAG